MESSIRSALLASLPGGQARATAVELLQGRVATAKVTAVLDIGSYQVELEGRSLAMRLPLDLRPGELFRIQLVNDADTPALKVSRDAAEASQPLSRLLAQALPRQSDRPGELAPALRELAALAGSLPRPLTGALRTVLTMLPSGADLARQETLSRWLHSGGLLLERRLGSAGGDGRRIEGDFKAALLRLQQALQVVARAGDGRAATARPADPRPADPRAATETATARGNPASVPAPEPRPTAAQRPAGPAPPVSAPTGQSSERSASPPQDRATAPRATPPAEDTALPTPGPARRAATPTATVGGRGPTPAAADAEPERLNALLDRVREQVEGGLARLQLNQARVVQGQAEGTPQWCLDVPLADNDLGQALRLAIRDQRQHPQGDAGWQAELHLSPPALGPIRVRLHLRGEHLDTVIWAEQPQTARLLGDALPLLDSALAAIGLQPAACRCYCGTGPDPGTDLADGPFGGILDERA